MEGLKKSFLVRGNNIVGFSDKNFSTCPIGTVLSFAGQTAPHGYLLCDGASYKVADYPHLYAVIGNTYGGDSTNFNVPNLVDKFVQGSTTSGTEKEAGLPNITGGWMPSVPVGYENYATGAVAAEIKSSGLVSSSGTQLAIGAGFKIDASKSSAVYGKSTTVQPPALTMVYIIKAFHTNEGVDSKNEVSDPIIEYVDGEIAKVETEVKGSIEELNNNLNKPAHGFDILFIENGVLVEKKVAQYQKIGNIVFVSMLFKYTTNNLYSRIQLPVISSGVAPWGMQVQYNDIIGYVEYDYFVLRTPENLWNTEIDFRCGFFYFYDTDAV